MNKITILFFILSTAFANAQHMNSTVESPLQEVKQFVQIKDVLSNFRDSFIDHLLFLESINKERIDALSETIRAQQSTIDSQKSIIHFKDKEMEALKEKILLFQERFKRIGELIKDK